MIGFHPETLVKGGMRKGEAGNGGERRGTGGRRWEAGDKRCMGAWMGGGGGK